MLLTEHEALMRDGVRMTYDEKYDGLQLVQWSKPLDALPWGYYATYKVGAEWVDEKESLVVTTKKGLEHIDFLRMFMTCFSSDLAVDAFSQIYSIRFDQPTIVAPTLRSVLSPLIIVHFIGIVSRIKSLKKGYVHHEENLRKVKGRINTLKNERVNIVAKRYDKVYCEYDEYSTDIAENRLLKKALVFSKPLITRMGQGSMGYVQLQQQIARLLTKFEGVGDEVNRKDVRKVCANKLFKEYGEAIRLAKMVLRYFDYSISRVGNCENNVPPFVLDMSLLYEHYVYGLLHEAYANKVTYQFSGSTGRPDFLYNDGHFKAILDTKYIPKYASTDIDIYVIRQLSGYSRDMPILQSLGYDDLDEETSIPIVPCIIIYPNESEKAENPFLGKPLKNLCTTPVQRISLFYKIAVALPTHKA